MQKKLKSLGVMIILLGFVLILNSSLTNITGNVISENINLIGSILGLIFIIGGLALFLSQKAGSEKDLEIIITKDFEKAIKKHPKEIIERALEKIGKGLANEEYLKYLKKWSIRTSKGGRILYERTPNEILVTDYLPPGKHY